jgi:hypothetical protein
VQHHIQEPKINQSLFDKPCHTPSSFPFPFHFLPSFFLPDWLLLPTMRLFKLCIGCYGEGDHDFAMYFFDSPITPPVGGHSNEDNFWKLEDLQAIFPSKPLTIHHIAPTYRTSYDYIRRDAHGHHYIAASALLDLASYMQIDLLGQLCRLSRQDIRNGRAESICKSLDIRAARTHMMIEQEFTPSDITPPSPMTPSLNGSQGANNNKRKGPALER